ncbi:MAG: hypothetical protein KDM81_16490 [Verrucomicrobiae bacterium]|nr:hypothetical protein [Verrucomicrobiae bacterium]
MYALFAGLAFDLARPDVEWFQFWTLTVPFVLVFSGIFITPAYFLLRRQYQNLCILAATLAALVVLLVLVSIPEDLGLSERIRRWTIESEWGLAFGLPYGLVVLIAPFYVARWVYRHGLALLLRHVHDTTPPQSAD